jgi:predicted amidohydrolase
VGLNFKYSLQDRSRYTGFQESKYITFGVAHRWRDAIMGSVRYDYGPIGVGFCYDVNVSRLVPATTLRGAMEFMVVYTGLYGEMKNTRLANPRFM